MYVCIYAQRDNNPIIVFFLIQSTHYETITFTVCLLLQIAN